MWEVDRIKKLKANMDEKLLNSTHEKVIKWMCREFNIPNPSKVIARYNTYRNFERKKY